MELRLARPQDLRDPRLRGGIEREPGQVGRERVARRGVAMLQSESPDLAAAFLDDVDDAPVREPRDRERRDPVERVLVVERRRQHLARLREEREPRLRPLGLEPSRLLRPVEARAID